MPERTLPELPGSLSLADLLDLRAELDRLSVSAEGVREELAELSRSLQALTRGGR